MRALACILLISGVPGAAWAKDSATSALNLLRREAGVAAVSHDSRLEAAAMAHARDMHAAGYFSHVGSDGSSVGDRVRSTGYNWCVVAENIAKGQADLAEVMAAWSASPGHRTNMLSPEVADVAVVEGPDSTWVMVLAAPGC